MSDQRDLTEKKAQEEPKTRCVACKQEIPAGASLCSVCKSYQRRWKNHLIYFAGLATMFALIVSADFWFTGNGRQLLGFTRDDLRLISANTVEGSAVVANRCDREVFVSHLILTMPGRSGDWLAPRLTFDKKLPAGQFLRREFPKSRLPDKAELVRGLDAEHFEALIKRAANGDPCFDPSSTVRKRNSLKLLL